jgi:hypothetical protein
MNNQNNLPVDFEAKIVGKPVYSISASDLMQNFADAKLIVDDAFLETTYVNNYAARKFRFPKPPASGTFVLGSSGGEFTWLPTTDC